MQLEMGEVMRRSLLAVVLCLAMLPSVAAMASDQVTLSTVSVTSHLTYLRSHGGDKYFVGALNSSTELKVVLAHDMVDGPRETVASMCRRYHCLAGINGDFFGGTVPMGGIVTNGHLMRTPAASHDQIMMAEGSLILGSAPRNDRVLFADDKTHLALPLNMALNLGWTSLYTSAFAGPFTLPSESLARIYRCSCSGRPDRYGQHYQLRLVSIVRSGKVALRVNEVAIVARGAQAKSLRWGQHTGATIIIPKLSSGEAIGANPVLIHKGVTRQLAGPFALLGHPRTVIARNTSGKTWLIAIDSRVSLIRAAQIARSLGATEAVNLDGGGSTTFVIRGVAVNNPADKAERAVASAILVVAKTTKKAYHRPTVTHKAVKIPPQAIKPPAAAPVKRTARPPIDTHLLDRPMPITLRKIPEGDGSKSLAAMLILLMILLLRREYRRE